MKIKVNTTLTNGQRQEKLAALKNCETVAEDILNYLSHLRMTFADAERVLDLAKQSLRLRIVGSDIKPIP